MEATGVIFAIIAGLVGLLIQYFVIKGAVVAAIRQTRDDKATPPASAGPTAAEQKFFGNADES